MRPVGAVKLFEIYRFAWLVLWLLLMRRAPDEPVRSGEEEEERESSRNFSLKSESSQRPKNSKKIEAPTVAR